MSYWNIILLLAIPVFGALIWLLFPRRKTFNAGDSSGHLNTMPAMPMAKHFLYFPQIRQALSAADAQYLKETASPEIAERALLQRRAVARSFLKGLREDFVNLARLGRVLAALSPSVSRKEETERLLLYLKFHVLYSLVWLRLSSGNLPLHQLEHLTGLVETLASRMEEAMTNISALSAGRLSDGFSA